MEAVRQGGRGQGRGGRGAAGEGGGRGGKRKLGGEGERERAPFPRVPVHCLYSFTLSIFLYFLPPFYSLLPLTLISPSSSPFCPRLTPCCSRPHFSLVPIFPDLFLSCSPQFPVPSAFCLPRPPYSCS